MYCILVLFRPPRARRGARACTCRGKRARAGRKAQQRRPVRTRREKPRRKKHHRGQAIVIGRRAASLRGGLVAFARESGGGRGVAPVGRRARLNLEWARSEACMGQRTHFFYIGGVYGL